MHSSLPFAPLSVKEQVRQGYLARLRELIQEDWTRLEMLATDPLTFLEVFWPDVHMYDKQKQILESIRDNDETIVVAGHQLGKDYVAGAAILWAFLCHRECRVVVTSVKHDHLRVCFGEAGRFIQTSVVPLTVEDGGPLLVNHWDIRKIIHGERCPISYLRGMVSEKGEGMAGHHAKYTLAVFDEASGIEDVTYERCTTWAKRILAFGNPYPPGVGCTFFKNAVKQGDILAKGG